MHSNMAMKNLGDVAGIVWGPCWGHGCSEEQRSQFCTFAVLLPVQLAKENEVFPLFCPPESYLTHQAQNCALQADVFVQKLQSL